jgi:hypothetical protein
MGRPAKDYNDGQTLSTVIASRSSAHPTLQRALHEVDPQFLDRASANVSQWF